MSAGVAKRLLIAGGGTGGHLFPAMAVAEAWQGQAGGGELLFVGTKAGLEARLVPERGWALATLDVGQLKGGGAVRRLQTVMGLPRALLQARAILKEYKPHVVLGVGGYASAPAVVAARMAGVPTLLHEQNAFPGLTNRWLSRITRKVLITFPESAHHFPGRLVQLTGNPVRASFLAEAGRVETGQARGEGPLRLLVFAGSQGAESFNQVVPEGVAQVVRDGHELEIYQQVRGEENVARVEGFYREQGITARVAPFIHQMTEAMAWADLIVCRAGATSLAEITVMGKAALLIPYPYAADDHQTANARSLVEAGGGWMCPQGAFTPQWLQGFLKERLCRREELVQTGRRAGLFAKPDAAWRIVEALNILMEQTLLHP